MKVKLFMYIRVSVQCVKDVAPMMKSSYESMMFLLCLEVFNKNGDLSVKFVFVSSNDNMQIIALLIHEN